MESSGRRKFESYILSHFNIFDIPIQAQSKGYGFG